MSLVLDGNYVKDLRYPISWRAYVSSLDPQAPRFNGAKCFNPEQLGHQLFLVWTYATILGNKLEFLTFIDKNGQEFSMNENRYDLQRIYAQLHQIGKGNATTNS